MTSELQGFFAENAGGIEVDFIVSERFKGSDGSFIPWKLRSVTEEENDEIRKAATKRVQVRKGVFMPETNPTEYLAKLVVASVTFPNLKTETLLKSYGVFSPEELVRKMLLAGEYSALVEKVQDINGYDKGLNDLIDEAKN